MPRIEPVPWNELKEEQRKMIEDGMASGGFTDPVPLQIMAYAHHDSAPDDGDRHPNFPTHLLGGKLLELLRIRSAQLGGCEPCMASRKVEDAKEHLVACLANPALSENLNVRETLALEYLNLMATDHHSIGDEMYRRLSEHFTTAEIIELGMTCSHMIGTHRFLHTLDALGDSEPVIKFDASQMGATWAELHTEEQNNEQPS